MTDDPIDLTDPDYAGGWDSRQTPRRLSWDEPAPDDLLDSFVEDWTDPSPLGADPVHDAHSTHYVPPSICLTDNDGRDLGRIRADDLIAALIVARQATAPSLAAGDLYSRLDHALHKLTATPGRDQRLTALGALLEDYLALPDVDDPETAITALERRGRL